GPPVLVLEFKLNVLGRDVFGDADHHLAIDAGPPLGSIRGSSSAPKNCSLKPGSIAAHDAGRQRGPPVRFFGLRALWYRRRHENAPAGLLDVPQAYPGPFRVPKRPPQAPRERSNGPYLMLLLVGLGNPGSRYAGNRHNIGFMAVDAIAKRRGIGPWRRRFQGVSAEGPLGGERALLLLPGTYMNESGRAVAEAAHFYKLGLSD